MADPKTATTPKTRAPRNSVPKTFDDHFTSFSKAYRSMNESDRSRAIAAVQALYPNHTVREA